MLARGSAAAGSVGTSGAAQPTRAVVEEHLRINIAHVAVPHVGYMPSSWMAFLAGTNGFAACCGDLGVHVCAI